MQTVSAQWPLTITSSRAAAAWVEVWDGPSLLGRLSPKSGDVNADFVSGIRRSLSATFTPSDAAKAMLYPGVELRAFSGLNYGTGAPEVVSVGRFPLVANSLDIDPATDITVSCQDQGQWITRTPFQTPYTAPAGQLIRNILTRLVLDTGMWSAAQVINTVSSTAVAVTQVWDTDRNQAMSDLATSVGAEYFVDRFGNLVIQDRRARSASVVTIAPGDGGRLIGLANTTDTSNVYNAVIVTTTTADPAFTFPSQVFRVTDPTSPAYYRPGKTPQNTFRLESAQFTSPGQAKAAAQKVLTKISAAAKQNTITCLTDPAIDESDTITLIWPSGAAEVCQVQSITYPLTAGGDMQITTVSTRSDEDFTP